jgi:hypothetical protein
MKYKIIHLFVKLTNLFQTKIVTTKVNKKIIFLFFIIAVIAMQLRTFTRFHWIIHYHVIHELYCHFSSQLFSEMRKCFVRCIFKSGGHIITHEIPCINKT